MPHQNNQWIQHESLVSIRSYPGKVLHSFAPFSIFLPGYDSFNTGWNRLPLIWQLARDMRGFRLCHCYRDLKDWVAYLKLYNHSSLVGGLEHEWIIFPYIGNFIIPTDFHIFQRGRYTTNQFYDVLCVTPSLETLSMAIYDSTGYISTYLNLGCNRIYWFCCFQIFQFLSPFIETIGDSTKPTKGDPFRDSWSIYTYVNYNDLTATEPWKSWLIREIMVNKGNHPQMALIQVNEIL